MDNDEMVIKPKNISKLNCSLCFVFLIILSSCSEPKTSLRLANPTIFELNQIHVVRIGDLVHSNKVIQRTSQEPVTLELELGGIHSSYGKGTAINFVGRILDSSNKNLKRPRVLTHRMFDGNYFEFSGAKIEIISFTSNTVTFKTLSDFNQVPN